MIHKDCDNGDLARGIVQCQMKGCDSSTYANYTYCTECSNKLGKCEKCGENLLDLDDDSFEVDDSELEDVDDWDVPTKVYTPKGKVEPIYTEIECKPSNWIHPVSDITKLHQFDWIVTSNLPMGGDTDLTQEIPIALGDLIYMVDELQKFEQLKNTLKNVMDDE